mmetsp:Transcript_10785/g.26144  ORF Transcript_10785/g.26144 Transcript_10785/m.26144 type:complete len:94 (+) Transcript_10785:203-484(+)
MHHTNVASHRPLLTATPPTAAVLRSTTIAGPSAIANCYHNSSSTRQQIHASDCEASDVGALGEGVEDGIMLLGRRGVHIQPHMLQAPDVVDQR